MTLIQGPIGTIVSSKGKRVEVRWNGKKRIYVHEKKHLAKVGAK